MQIQTTAFVSGANGARGVSPSNLAQSPVVAPKPAVTPVAPPKTELEEIRAWIRHAQGPQNVAQAVQQNPTGHGLVFRRRFQFTDVLQVEEGTLRKVEPNDYREKR